MWAMFLSSSTFAFDKNQRKRDNSGGRNYEKKHEAGGNSKKEKKGTRVPTLKGAERKEQNCERGNNISSMFCLVPNFESSSWGNF